MTWDQMDAFSSAPRFPRARVSDPKSSHEAATLIERTGLAAHQRNQALMAVRLWPNSTTMELARAAKMDRYALARRCPELAKDGLIRQIRPSENTVPCAVSKKRVCRWLPV